MMSTAKSSAGRRVLAWRTNVACRQMATRFHVALLNQRAMRLWLKAPSNRRDKPVSVVRSVELSK